MVSSSQSYYLLLLDLKKSTSISSKSLQKSFKRLKLLLEQLNDSPSPKPVIPLTISYGDEIAGLFHSPKEFYNLISRLRAVLYPDLRFRFVAARGKIGVASQDIRAVGGEVFKKADEQLKRLKRQDAFCHWSLKSQEQDAILASLTEMANTLLEKMTPYQRSVCNLLDAGLSQKEIAKKLKKYPQSVSDAVKRSAADQVVESGHIINTILSTL